MSVEKKLLERWVKIIVFPEYYPLREETATFLAQPEQGGYDEATIKDEEIRKLEEQVARSEFTAALARGNKDSLHEIVGTKELDYSNLSQGEQQRIVEIRKTYGIRDEQ